MPRLLISDLPRASENEVPAPLANLSPRLMENRIFPDPISRTLFTQRLALLIKRLQTSAPNTGKEKSPNDDRLCHYLESNPYSSS
jgi:hypothetical protein